MNRSKSITPWLLCGGLVLLLHPSQGQAESPGAAAGGARQAPVPRDGQRDFDFEIGSWKTRLSRLQRPLTGSSAWVQYEGTSIVRPISGGRANLVELDVEGPAGRIQGVGEFKDGRGEFYSQETLNGRAILARFVISEITPDSCRFEQAFSDDGGRTWEVNWIATDTRLEAGAGALRPPPR